MKLSLRSICYVNKTGIYSAFFCLAAIFNAFGLLQPDQRLAAKSQGWDHDRYNYTTT